MTDDDCLDQRAQVDTLLERLPYSSHRWMFRCGVIGVVGLGVGAYVMAALVVPARELTVPLFLAGFLPLMLGFVNLVLLGAFAFNRRYVRGRLDRMVAGERLAHWTYEDRDWAAFVAHQRRERDAATVVSAAGFQVAALMGLIFAVIAAFAGWNVDFPWLASIALGFALGFVIGLITQVFQWLSWMRWCRALERERGPALISRDAVFFHSRMLNWNSFGCTLTSVTLERCADLALLKFRVNVQSGRNAVEHLLSAPVPSGRLEDAERVVAALMGAPPEGTEHSG